MNKSMAELEGAYLAIGVVVSLGSTIVFAALVFGVFPSCPSCTGACAYDENDSVIHGEPSFCTLAGRWFCYKCCGCCGCARLGIREWLQEDIKRMDKAEKLIVE